MPHICVHNPPCLTPAVCVQRTAGEETRRPTNPPLAPVRSSPLIQPMNSGIRDFHLPPGKAVLTEGGPPTAGTPSNFTIPANEMHVTLFVPDPNPETEYSHLMRLASSETGNDGIFRQTLYQYFSTLGIWIALDSVEVTHPGFTKGGEYRGAGWVSLPASYEGLEIFGHLAIGLQSITAGLQFARRGINSNIAVAYQSFFITANGNNYIQTFADPDTYGSAIAYVVERLPEE